MAEREVFAMFDGEVSDNGFTRGRSGLGIGDVKGAEDSINSNIDPG